MASQPLRLWLGCAVLAACVPELEPPGSAGTSTISLIPPPISGITSRSVRVATRRGETLRLFRETLSSRQLGNIRRGDVGQSLADVEVPLTALESDFDGGVPSGPDGETQLWLPNRLLESGAGYTLVTEHAALGFSTMTGEPVLTRVWPSEQATSSAVFCLETGLAGPLANPDLLIEPNLVRLGETNDGGVASGLDGWLSLAHSPPCWFWAASESSTWPEPGSGVAVEPTLPAPHTDTLFPAPVCEGSVTLDWGCITAQDDRVLVQGGPTTSLWVLDSQPGAWFVLGPGNVGVVRGLIPGRSYELRFTVYFPTTAPLTQTAIVETLPPRERLVINEVLADPLGSESTQEWVELHNDGSSAVNVEGWQLADEGGSVELPATWIAPGGYALLVNETYVPNAADDPVPEANVLLVRLPSLGKSGLSNNGETLRLINKSDMVVSSFPGTPKPTPGVSVARGAPWQVDGDTAAFGLHAAPGASPGAPNAHRAGPLAK